MTDKPTCDICAKPVPDTAYACERCTSDVRDGLDLVVKLAGEAMTTIAKLDCLDPTGSSEPDTDPWDKNPGALYPTPLPYDPGAAKAHDAAVSTVVTWARHISEERGIGLPLVMTGEHPTAVVALWLTSPDHRNLDWLRHRQEAAEALGELLQACKVLERVVDRPPARIVAGQCPCGTFLYAIRGKADVRCDGCGTSYDVESTREQLRRTLGDALFTAAEIATLAAYLGIGGSRERIRKLINQWHTRGRLVVHDYQGEPAFRFGEVIARLAAPAS